MSEFGESLNRQADRAGDPYGGGEDGGATLMLLLLILLVLPFYLYWRVLKLPFRMSLLLSAVLCFGGLALREFLSGETARFLVLMFCVLAGGALLALNALRGLSLSLARRREHDGPVRPLDA